MEASTPESNVVDTRRRATLPALACYFLYLGTLGFGGPGPILVAAAGLGGLIVFPLFRA